MKTSPAGRALIERREGRRLRAYRDTKGILTIGVGHTGRMSSPRVRAGMTITEAECDAMLASDLAPVEATIARCVKVPLTQNESDAMASLGFNIGIGGLARSSVVRLLNQGNVAGAADAFMAWSKPAVLVGRRREERAQFLTRDAEDHVVAAARSDTLAAHAAVKRAKSRSSAFVATLTAAPAASVVAASVIQHGHHPILWLAGSLGIGFAAVDGIAALVRGRFAATLATNAQKQAAAATLAPPAIPVSAKP